ncbi:MULTISPECIES: hypothetical protein [unclassified Paenibacillus]|uniref:hypothetical protein n=1 Tax=unclassified Paenibacillus TaxID=185978 RepID=UPI001C0F5A36|nr:MULTISPECIES: hypothetical protein [unclassified Paenibacillus]MBU5440589.1 hypothetical protein [Paenibacillus sp. MSJ-34]CAH0120055.1 hypothetical protein PAE9249_02568 [Paenibacillus sp. CECT 9249]
MPSAAFNANSTTRRLERIFDPDHPLCKEDVVWILEYIKKKVADEDPSLLDLSQPRLLKNFHCFAEVALSLIHRRTVYDQEIDGLRSYLAEAVHGLYVHKS